MTSRRRSRTARSRPLWGYAPLGVGLVLVVAMVALAPSRVPADRAGAGGGTATEVGEGRTASGWGTSVTPCDDRGLQVPGDGYSPPCFAFDGDNGGATSPGVSGDTITVSYRLTAEPNVIGLLAQLAGMEFDETYEDLERTARGLVDYFNENFQFYGRHIELEGYQGRGGLLAELFGGGQENATGDALTAADEIGAFADVTALTQPYADALYRNQVVAFGAPYMSREWFEGRRPYAWSSVPDCTAVSEAATEYANKRLVGRPAEYAGGDLRDRERRIAIIAPDNLEYQQCVDAGLRVMEEAGNEVDLRLDYVLDVAQAATQAPSLLAKLKDNGITSVACACDPLTLMSLAGEANAQDYQPEWLIMGVGFGDLDLVGQMIQSAAPGQWDRAFGGSPQAAQPAFGTSEAYRAYRSVRDDEPSLLVDVVYYQLLPLALGVQMAGPDLTPENLETGLFAYPGGTGVAGTWDFSPGHYTPVTDIREVWWDGDRRSAFNGQTGTYVDDGERYERGHLPEGDPEVFR
ncbi:MAG TPA: ABC transporter substrate-binding protein [Acidimicrobiales bacterium]